MQPYVLKMTTKLFTLVFLKRNNSVLLGYKTRGLGEGFWNGFGGKLEKNEPVTTCARRELKEECNLLATDLRHIGVIKYETDYEGPAASVVHVFTCSKFNGEASPSEEMNPIQWYNYNEIPFSQMWPDAKLWYPLMLEEKFFSANIIYSQNVISKFDIQEHSDLSNALTILRIKQDL